MMSHGDEQALTLIRRGIFIRRGILIGRGRHMGNAACRGQACEDSVRRWPSIYKPVTENSWEKTNLPMP
jgi:hypothetical protein